MAYDFDVIVIGGGAAGLTSSGMAANFGAKTLMIERHLLGGDCTWTGCVPSKAILKAGKVAHQIRKAAKYGIVEQDAQVDFKKVMAHVHHIRDDIYEDADRPEIYEDMGVEVRFGEARFVDDHTIELTREGQTERISSRYFAIAAGASAWTPPIPGLESVPHYTNHSLFDAEVLPERLAIIGAGPIGIEMAQAFSRLGSKVTSFDMAQTIMPRDDAELTNMLQHHLEKEGIIFVLGARVKSVSQEEGTIVIQCESGGKEEALAFDALLVATGRRPNLEALNLEAGGVAYTKHGITVNNKCRTNKRHIYALGDVTGRYQFTHMSEHMAKVGISNMILKMPMKIDTAHVPWVTYTDPELAHLGATPAELEEKGIAFKTYRFPYTKVDRAVMDSEPTGLIKVYAKSFSGKILGADILGVGAGELISEYVVAMRNGITLRQIADTIHPYPTYALGARRAADQWYVQKQSMGLVKLLKFLFRYRGPVNAYEPGTIV